MKIVYFGTGEFAVAPLRAVAEHISLVVTQPDRPGRRGMKLQPTPVKSAALELGLPVETPERSRAPEFVDRLRSEVADMLLVASYGQILSEAVLESAAKGGINLHGSILPEYRGAAPIQRCILDGHTDTGVTIIQMDKGMDTGDVITFDRILIEPEETYGELQDRLSVLAAEMAARWVPRIAAGDYPRIPQDHGSATIAPKIKKEEAEINLTGDGKKEHCRYRAFTPSPGAFIRTRFGQIRVSRAHLLSEAAEPGTVVSPGVVALAGGALELIEVQPEGKKRMSGRDFMNGVRLKPGMNILHE